ncbi:MAG: PPC domain-containing protein [Gemmataceae bacterium]|nr:PPC domain-containing protein [Gemmataceae bacterium]
MPRSQLTFVLVAGTLLTPWPATSDEKVYSLGKDGLTLHDTITKDDPRVKVTEPKTNRSADVACKRYRVQFLAGFKYRLDMVGKDFDTVLAIHDEAGQQIAFDDDSGGVTDARLEFTPDKDGAYTVIAGALGPPGAFKLTIISLGKAETTKPAGEPIVVAKQGATVSGKVSGNDPKVGLTIGKRVEQFPGVVHSVKLIAGKKYQIDVAPTADSGLEVPLLLVQDSSGKQLDWAAPDIAPRVQLLAPLSETYRIWVATGSGEGPYSLTIKEIPLLKEETSVHDLASGEFKMNGRLSKEVRVVSYRVKAAAGKTYVIDMTSPSPKEVDPYLRLFDSNGKLLAEHDDIKESVDLNARIMFRAESAGEYRIDASSFGNLGAGPYNLQVKEKQ